MNKKVTVFLALLFFCCGIGAAIFLRLVPMSHDHGDHSSELETVFKIAEQPLEKMTGEATSLSAEIGAQPALINFWATWCAPCLHEIPLLEQAQAQHKVKTIGVTYEDLTAIESFTIQHPVAYPLFKSSFDIFYFFQQQGNRTAVLPYTVLIDANGEIIAEKIGDFKTIEEINKFVSLLSTAI
ncbi:MAG: TlpA family protein disulfide reductase [Proteobacteria bacterium]|nr:TlpA family protein disulfide reductase [Pseudomonadota bacterium]